MGPGEGPQVLWVGQGVGRMSRFLCHGGCGHLQWDTGQTHTRGHEHDDLGKEPEASPGMEGARWTLLVRSVGSEAPHQLTVAPSLAGTAAVSSHWVLCCLARPPGHPPLVGVGSGRSSIQPLLVT